MPLEDYRPAQLEPQKLSNEEVVDPIVVIDNFFSYAHLPEVRGQLWELLKTTITGNYCRMLSRRERSDLVYFYEQLEKLIEASHLIHTREKEARNNLLKNWKGCQEVRRTEILNLFELVLEAGDKHLIEKMKEVYEEYERLFDPALPADTPDIQKRKDAMFENLKGLFVEAIMKMKIPETLPV